MSSIDSKNPSAVGFLTVLENPQLGLLGGYLVLNLLGRPLEFHCTTPVKPNRAQQILYGPTLLPYLYGEQIGQALVTKATVKPIAVLTDLPPVLALRGEIALPVILVETPPAAAGVEPSADAPLWRADPAQTLKRPALRRFRLGDQDLAVEEAFQGDQEIVTARLAAVAEGLDLCEPFGRIRDAIEEAQRGGR